MTITLVTTVGAATANSYATEAEADAYFETVQWYDPIWTAITDQQERFQILIESTRLFDTFEYKGQPALSVSDDQALKFPRSNQDDTSILTFGPREEVVKGQLQLVMYQRQQVNTTTGKTPTQYSVIDVFEQVRVEQADQSQAVIAAADGTLERFFSMMAIWVQPQGSISVVK